MLRLGSVRIFMGVEPVDMRGSFKSPAGAARRLGLDRVGVPDLGGSRPTAASSPRLARKTPAGRTARDHEKISCPPPPEYV